MEDMWKLKILYTLVYLHGVVVIVKVGMHGYVGNVKKKRLYKYNVDIDVTVLMGVWNNGSITVILLSM